MSDAGEATARCLLCCCCGSACSEASMGGSSGRSRAAASSSPVNAFDAMWNEWEAEAARAAAPAAQQARTGALPLLPSASGRRAARALQPREPRVATAAPGEILELVRSQTERFFDHLRSEAATLRAENAALREEAAVAAATAKTATQQQQQQLARTPARRLRAFETSGGVSALEVIGASTSGGQNSPRELDAAAAAVGTPRWHDPCSGPWYDGAPLATALPAARVRSAAAGGEEVAAACGAFTAHIAGIGSRPPRHAPCIDDADAAERGLALNSARSAAESSGEDSCGAESGSPDSARSGGSAMRLCRAAAASCGASMEALSALLHLRSGAEEEEGCVYSATSQRWGCADDDDDCDSDSGGAVTAPPLPAPRAWVVPAALRRRDLPAEPADDVASRGARPPAAHAPPASEAGDDVASLASLRALRRGAVAAAEAAAADAAEALRRGAPPPRAPHAPGAAAAAEAAAEAVREASDGFAARSAGGGEGEGAMSAATSAGVRRGALPRPPAWPFPARGGDEAQPAPPASSYDTTASPSSLWDAPHAHAGLAYPRDYWDDEMAARSLRSMPCAEVAVEPYSADDGAMGQPVPFAAALVAAAAAQSDATAAAAAALARAAALTAASEALCARCDDDDDDGDDGASALSDNAAAAAAAAAAGGGASVSAKGAVGQPVEARDAEALRARASGGSIKARGVLLSS